MCLAIPGQIVALLDDDRRYALVDVSGVRRKINMGLVKHMSPQVGDWVLIHVGFAMNMISAEQAAEQLRLLEMLDESEAALEEVRGYKFGEAGGGG